MYLAVVKRLVPFQPQLLLVLCDRIGRREGPRRLDVLFQRMLNDVRAPFLPPCHLRLRRKEEEGRDNLY